MEQDVLTVLGRSLAYLIVLLAHTFILGIWSFRSVVLATIQVRISLRRCAGPESVNPFLIEVFSLHVNHCH